MLIRRAKKSDVDTLFEIETISFGDISFSKRALTYHIVNNLVLCAELDGKTVGYICFSPLTKNKKRRIYSIAVHPSARGQHIAEKLMLESESKSKAHTIYLEVDENNRPALYLYLKLGYTVFGTYPGYYGDSDALRMKKVIK